MFVLGGNGRDATRTTGAPCHRGVHLNSPGGDTAFRAADTAATQRGEATGATETPIMEVTQPTWDGEGDNAASAPGGMRGAPTTAGYLDMAAAIAKCSIGDATSQVRELLWQKRVEGNSAKIKQFQEVAGALQDFKTYLFHNSLSAKSVLAGEKLVARYSIST
jgi:hypothetical protein